MNPPIGRPTSHLDPSRLRSTPFSCLGRACVRASLVAPRSGEVQVQSLQGLEEVGNLVTNFLGCFDITLEVAEGTDPRQVLHIPDGPAGVLHLAACVDEEGASQIVR